MPVKPKFTFFPLRVFFIFLMTIVLVSVILTGDLFFKPGTLRVHFIMVGYGDAILIELPGKKNVLIDAGTQKYAPALLDYLRSRNIFEIDTAILTHPHDNHFGGFVDLLGAFKINRFFYNGDERSPEEGYDDVIRKITEMGIPLKKLTKGDRLFLDKQGTQLFVLHPGRIEGSTNENSLATWLTFGSTSFLFTADIKKKQQRAIIENFPVVKEADCVQVPHHGGKVSTKFADFLGPKVYIVSTGKNKWDKPFFKELAKLQGDIYRTDVSGTIVVESDGKTVQVIKE